MFLKNCQGFFGQICKFFKIYENLVFLRVFLESKLKKKEF